MRAIFMTILGASTILLGTLTLTDHSASAMSLPKKLICKHNPVTGPLAQEYSLAQAKYVAKMKWEQVVTQYYGHSWADSSKAKSPHYYCVGVTATKRCKFTATPCKHVKVVFPSSVAPPEVYPGITRRPSTKRKRAQYIKSPARLRHYNKPPARLRHNNKPPARLRHFRFLP